MPTVANITRPILRWSYGDKEYSYTVTDEDRVWFTRAIWREGAPQFKVGHTLLQRFAYLYSTKVYNTLAAFLLAYAQPINPEWRPGGSKSNARIKRLLAKGDKKGAQAERERAKQRAIFANTPIAQIPREYREIASDILAGATVSKIPQAMHFTASFTNKSDDEQTAKVKAKAYAQKRGLNIVQIPEGFRSGVNWFFSVPGKTPPRVTVGRVSIAAAGSSLPMVLIGMIVTLFIFGKKPRN